MQKILNGQDLNSQAWEGLRKQTTIISKVKEELRSMMSEPQKEEILERQVIGILNKDLSIMSEGLKKMALENLIVTNENVVKRKEIIMKAIKFLEEEKDEHPNSINK
jgi:hypothetical protein